MTHVLRIQALVVGFVLSVIFLISCVSNGVENSGVSQVPAVPHSSAVVVQLEVKAAFDFFDMQSREGSKSSTFTRINIPVGGTAVVSGSERGIALNDGPKKKTKHSLSVYLESINNGVAFAEFRLQRLVDGADAEEVVKLKIAAPLDKEATSSLNAGDEGVPGSFKSCTVSMKPSLVTNASPRSERE